MLHRQQPLRQDKVTRQTSRQKKLLVLALPAAVKAEAVCPDQFSVYVEILEKNGQMMHHMLAQGPGRHCSGAFLDGTPVIGISGPPMGAEFTVDWMVKPLVDRYLGLPGDYPPMVFARMESAPDFWPGPVQVVKRGIVYRDENDELWARLLPLDERPVLRALDEAASTEHFPEQSFRRDRKSVV